MDWCFWKLLDRWNSHGFTMWFALPHTDSARELGKQPKYGLNISFDILSIFFKSLEKDRCCLKPLWGGAAATFALLGLPALCHWGWARLGPPTPLEKGLWILKKDKSQQTPVEGLTCRPQPKVSFRYSCPVAASQPIRVTVWAEEAGEAANKTIKNLVFGYWKPDFWN